MQDDRIWYFYSEAGAQGPYTASEIVAWRAAGQVTDDWHVWREGFEGWQRLGDTPEIIAPPAAAALAPARVGAGMPAGAGTSITPHQPRAPQAPVIPNKTCPACGTEGPDEEKCGYCGVVYAEWGRSMEDEMKAAYAPKANQATLAKAIQRESSMRETNKKYKFQPVVSVKKASGWSAVGFGVLSFFCFPYIAGAAAISAGAKSFDEEPVLAILGIVLGICGIATQIYFMTQRHVSGG